MAAFIAGQGKKARSAVSLLSLKREARGFPFFMPGFHVRALCTSVVLALRHA
jgi:hypothetical protein